MDILSLIRKEQYPLVVFVGVVVFDYLCNISTDWQLVWTEPWTMVSITYCVLRYLGITIQATFMAIGFTAVESAFSASDYNDIACFQAIDGNAYATYGLTQFSFWASTFYLSVLQILMIARVYALYKRNRKLGYGLGAFFVIETACILFAQQWTLAHPHDGFALGVGCVPWLAFEATLFALTINALMKQMKTTWGYKAKNWHPILKIIVRDSSMYFLMILLANALMAICTQLSPEAATLGPACGVFVTNIVGPRLILGLRKHRSDNDPVKLTMLHPPHHRPHPYSQQTPRSGAITQQSDVIIISGAPPEYRTVDV
ncbi:hypothetical protein CONPUDRAFT_170169 [Coniophora puteana RWD-64-598 SS2]|uniref:DUF6533 domain-containing protein n=1 Tax=Coniophora puteana (strain RWD-64-598) TaxID=741705 RepID=R7SHC1_CONPW|nr:uncharacterized protein CONPUDRAFT_170169 [Coniophora puteana RWD-64-598 SS2]EIW74469.1 hypothetical protein CONPUDRAFT_170169 [Coniophora puteana RWD-64-598 SS2]